MRSDILTGDTPFRRACLRSVIDQVEVDDAEIRIISRKTVLERLVMGGGASPAGVPSFVPKWRARRDSNPWPLPSEGSALSS
jgi:site-specific DNA recombinase